MVHPLLPDDANYGKELSIIFGTYNRFDLLKKSVESVRRACSDIGYEIIVSDGGSVDRSFEWMEEQEDIRPLRGGLDGAVKAFNQCFAEAKGRYILNLNDDAELSGGDIGIAIRHFSDPMVGQVALIFKKPNEKFSFEHARDRLYANYGLTRKNVANAISGICGGFWCPEYYTYGADAELSLWVWRLGYRVVEERGIMVVDHQCNDPLRSRNHKREQGVSSKIFGKRWPSHNHTTFRGPHSEKGTNQGRITTLEAGELPEQRWPRLHRSDTDPGRFPPRAPLLQERLLHVQIKTNEDPQTQMVAGLRSLGSHGYGNVDWIPLSLQQREAEIWRLCQELNPTVVFIQIQGPHLTTELIRGIRRGTRDPSMVLAFWCGDVGWPHGPWKGFKDEWQHEMARHSDVMLFTGTGQVEIQRSRGMRNAAYLQIGYDTDRYYPGSTEDYGKLHDIVFTGQNYDRHFDRRRECDGAPLRREVVKAFSQSFGPRFGHYGNGWGRGIGPLHQAQSSDVFRKSLIALSTSLSSSLARYSSDRLLRTMACGTATLVKRFPDMEGMGMEHGKNVLIWDTVDHAVELAREWLKQERRTALLDLGRKGAKLVREHHTWKVRMEELSAILRALRGQPL